MLPKVSLLYIRLKNYYWPLAFFHAKLPNGQPLPKVVGPPGRLSEKYVNICAVLQHDDIVVSVVASSNEKCTM